MRQRVKNCAVITMGKRVEITMNRVICIVIYYMTKSKKLCSYYLGKTWLFTIVQRVKNCTVIT